MSRRKSDFPPAYVSELPLHYASLTWLETACIILGSLGAIICFASAAWI